MKTNYLFIWLLSLSQFIFLVTLYKVYESRLNDKNEVIRKLQQDVRRLQPEEEQQILILEDWE